MRRAFRETAGYTIAGGATDAATVSKMVAYAVVEAVEPPVAGSQPVVIFVGL